MSKKEKQKTLKETLEELTDLIYYSFYIDKDFIKKNIIYTTNYKELITNILKKYLINKEYVSMSKLNANIKNTLDPINNVFWGDGQLSNSYIYISTLKWKIKEGELDFEEDNLLFREEDVEVYIIFEFRDNIYINKENDNYANLMVRIKDIYIS